MLNVYRIKTTTNAILAQENSRTARVMIYEGVHKIPSIHDLNEILDANCLDHGSTLEGRLNYAKHILRTSIKLPVIIHPRKKIFMVPIRSLNSSKSGVISFYQVRYYLETNQGTDVYFHDGTRLSLDVSRSSFDMQYKKTGQLIASLFRPTTV